MSTQGAGANGVEATFNGASGAATIKTADVNTQGFLSIGVVGLTQGPNAPLTIDTTAGTIHTHGLFATGINAVTGSFPFSPPNAGTLTINAGNITTEGAGAAAIIANANGGAINITAGGAINTSGGDGIQTLNFSAAAPVTTTINVTGSISVAGNSSNGINARVIANGSNAITVSGSVTASGAGSTGIFTAGAGDTVTIASGASVSGETGVEVIDSGPETFTNSGTVTGTGGTAVTFVFGNATTFTNNNTINGDVLLGGGNDLAILNTGSTITGTLDAGGGTDTLRLGGSGTDTLDISKATNFEIGQKIGTGAWTLTGTGTISTSTTISGGVLSVNGQLTSPTVTVATGGTLAGTGTIIGNVTTNGTIAPGNSIGTLTVTGNYTQATGSTYTVELNTTTSDLINVNGAATIQNGTAVNVLVAPGFYPLGKQYTIVSATGGVTGQFSTLTDNAPFVDFALDQDANDIFLDVIRSGVPFQQIAQTRNEIAAAGGLQSLGFGNPIFDAALLLDASTARNAFNLLSGEIHPSINATLVDDSRFIRNAVIGRLRQELGGPLSMLAPDIATMRFAAEDDDAAMMAYARKPAKKPDPIGSALAAKNAATANERVFTVWGQLLGDWGHSASDGNAARLDRSTGGIISGIDATLAGQGGDLWRFGLAGGYQQTSVRVDDRVSSGNIAAYNVAAYAGMQQGPLGLRVGSAYTWHDISASRTISFPGFSDRTQSNYGAQTAQVFGEAAYGLVYQQVALEPFADLAFVDLHAGSFTEAGGAAALTGSDSAFDTTYSTLGLRAAALLPWATGFDLTVKGSAGWQHAFGTIVPTSTLAFAFDAFRRRRHADCQECRRGPARP